MATSLPFCCSSLMRRIFASGVASARKPSTPDSLAMAAAVRALSPVIITVRMPIARNRANRSAMPPFTTSLRWMIPSMRAPSDTASGVPPESPMRHAACTTSGGTVPPSFKTCSETASTAPFLTLRLPTSAPLIRVCALKGMNCATPLVSRPRIPYRSLSSTTIERPSGVSSARVASWVASARSDALTPGAGMRSVARRLPSVIVPVLSSSRVSTSPAASTALPLIASTFLRKSRSIPAMPMAESRPPMVVGMRQTRSATVATAPRWMPEETPIGTSVAQAKRKTMVRPTRRMWSAISFGVFCLAAPSTSAIIRSRNDSPGLAVMRTTIRSESTFVPPVTAERSPPLSRMTGADSPVIADSSTEAMPSMTSPSPGMSPFASTTTRSPFFSREAGIISSFAMGMTSSGGGQVRTLRAMVSFCIRRSVSACAFPRPSATASAKLAKITVNQSQMETASVNQRGAALGEGAKTSRSQTAGARTLPISTTNMTGFFATRTGESLRKLSTIAEPRIDLSKRDRFCALRAISEKPSSARGEVLRDRAERECREEGERADDDHDGDEEADEERSVGGEGSGAGGDDLFVHHRAGDPERRNDHQEPADQHVGPEGQVPEAAIGVEAGERRPVVPGAARKRVEDLGEPVRPRVGERGHPGRHYRRPRRQCEDDEREDEDVEHQKLHLPRLDLLAEVLGRPPDHQPREEDGEEDVDE